MAAADWWISETSQCTQQTRGIPSRLFQCLPTGRGRPNIEITLRERLVFAG